MMHSPSGPISYKYAHLFWPVIAQLPFGLISAILKNTQRCDASFPRVLSKSEKLCALSNVSSLDGQAGDLINQTENFIIQCKDAARETSENSRGIDVPTWTRALCSLIKLTFSNHQTPLLICQWCWCHAAWPHWRMSVRCARGGLEFPIKRWMTCAGGDQSQPKLVHDLQYLTVMHHWVKSALQAQSGCELNIQQQKTSCQQAWAITATHT